MDDKKKGKCINFGNCAKADNHEIIELGFTEDFECPECNGELQELKTKKSNGSFLNKKIVIVAVVLAILAVGAYLLFSDDGAKPTASIEPESATIMVDETVKLTAKTDPESTSKNVKWLWVSSDENIATVSRNGVVTGVGAGTVTITASSEKSKSISASSLITVELKAEPVPEPVQQRTPVQTRQTPSTGTGTKQYAFGRYEGNLVNGIPDGQGTMYYTCRVQIAKHGRNTYYAENGDTYVGTWGNGDIVNGNLFDRNNNQKATILAGKRPNPYDINNDKCE